MRTLMNRAIGVAAISILTLGAVVGMIGAKGSGVSNEMVLVPEGVFTMGNANHRFEEDSGGCDRAHYAAHEVKISSFYVDPKRATKSEYTQCIEAGGCTMIEDGPTVLLSNPGEPVTDLNWYQAAAYCRWKGKRMVREAEWEYIARAGTKDDFYPELSRPQRFSLHEASDGTIDNRLRRRNFDIGANRWGIYGLVSGYGEWLYDNYEDCSDYYRTGPKENPTGLTTGEEKARRGNCTYSIMNRRVSRYVSWNRKGLPPDYPGGTVRCAKDY